MKNATLLKVGRHQPRRKLLGETLSSTASSNQTHCQQSKAAHIMNMNQRQANQNHIPYLKVRYVTLNPRLNHVKRVFDNKYILFVIFPKIHDVLVMGLTTFLHG